jgi:hypothetical protein
LRRRLRTHCCACTAARARALSQHTARQLAPPARGDTRSKAAEGRVG